MISVLIADDDPHLREALAALVTDDPAMSVAAVCADGVDALAQIRSVCPDVAMLDVRMPGMSGLEVVRTLAREGTRTRLVVLTMFDLDEYAFEAISAGAAGFLLKNAPPTELLRAITVAAEGNALLAPEVTRKLISRFAAPRAAAEGQLERLTERELQTLALIGRGASNAEIADELVVTPTTVRTYVSRILTKLDARDRAQLVVLAHRAGLVDHL